jgi:hypothetical protein
MALSDAERQRRYMAKLKARANAGGDDAARQAEVAALKEEIAALKQENATLKAQLRERRAPARNAAEPEPDAALTRLKSANRELRQKLKAGRLVQRSI